MAWALVLRDEDTPYGFVCPSLEKLQLDTPLWLGSAEEGLVSDLEEVVRSRFLCGEPSTSHGSLRWLDLPFMFMDETDFLARMEDCVNQGLIIDES